MKKPIPMDYVRATCKIGQGNECCRYLVCGPDGFDCAKFSVHRKTLDDRAANKIMTARADNCAGWEHPTPKPVPAELA